MHELSHEGQIRYEEARDFLFELRDAGAEMPTLVGHFAVFGQWTEINSRFEGRFMERVAPGALDKTIAENRRNMRVLFQHGKDPQIGEKVLGPISVLRATDEGGYYEVPLYPTSYNRELIPGLADNQYGASFRFRTMKEDFPLDRAEPSEHNPEGLRERTITEMKVMEFGPVTFPAYGGASAGLRSATDWWYEQNLRSQLEQLGGFDRSLEGAAALEQEEQNAPVEPSRSTRSREPLRAQKGVYRLP